MTPRRSAAPRVAARSLDNVEILVTTLSERDVDATVQGLVLGGYRFAEFRSAKTAPKDAGLQKVTLLVGDKGRAQKEAMERAAAVATAVVTARDFVNTPPSHLFPAEFAKRAKALATAEGIEVEVLDEKELTKGGYGGIVGVGKGSSRPPRLVRLTYRGAKGKKAKSVALVGKGITFDTGGISIAGRRHGEHDLRYGRRGSGYRRHLAGRAPAAADRRDRDRADGREHALVDGAASR